MAQRQLPTIEHYGPTISAWESEFNLANTSIGEDSGLAEIDQVLQQLHAVRDQLNRAIQAQSLGELEEYHSFIRQLRHDRENLSAVLEELRRSGVRVPEQAQGDEVIALSRDSTGKYDDLAGWLLGLPASDPSHKAAAITYELENTRSFEAMMWQKIDDVLIDAAMLVNKIENAILSLEEVMIDIEEHDYLEGDLDRADQDAFEENEDESDKD